MDHVTLLRDFVAWEPRRMLRDRAQSILRRMEGALDSMPMSRDGSSAAGQLEPSNPADGAESADDAAQPDGADRAGPGPAEGRSG